MIQHPLLRLLMAAYLAIWSPIACCCAVKSALGAVTGAQVGCCAKPQAIIEGAKPQASMESVRSCCKQTEKPDCSEQQSQPQNSSDNCKCRSKLVKIAPSEAAAKVSVSLVVHELPAILASPFATLPAADVAKGLYANGNRSHAPPLGGRSLFAQHCLLTV